MSNPMEYGAPEYRGSRRGGPGVRLNSRHRPIGMGEHWVIKPDAQDRRGEPTVATLGPVGTDAHAEATRLGGDVILCDSFLDAMALAQKGECSALVAVGYLDMHAPSTSATWVDLHFSFRDHLQIASLWEAPTKEMCLAVSRDGNHDLTTIRSLALHASTRALVAPLVAETVMLEFVRAKPLAVQLLRAGEVDACLGSVDVVARYPELTILTRFKPTMVWCLYQSARAVVAA
jgi:hypothetical protein